MEDQFDWKIYPVWIKSGVAITRSHITWYTEYSTAGTETKRRSEVMYIFFHFIYFRVSNSILN